MSTASLDRGMIERDRELEMMREVLAAGRAGRGAVVVVEAPAGQGKTALLRALRGQALAAGQRVLGRSRWTS